MKEILKVVKKMLPAAGVAKLRDVTKSTFEKHVDDENRLGGWDIINQIIWICFHSPIF